MTALSGGVIKKRLEETDPKKRLVVCPILDVKDQLKDDQASIDIRLGFRFALISPSSVGEIDEFRKDGEPLSQIQGLYREEYVPFGASLVIHPHQFALASTLEYIRLPYDLMAYVVGRSTWGRLGLIVATAIGVHPRFAGCLTLELRNLGETPLRVYPGQTIAQLFFHTVEHEKIETESIGQYSGSVDLVPKNLSSKNTRDKIEVLKKKYEPPIT